MIDLLQQLLKQGRKIEIGEDQLINNSSDLVEQLKITDAVTSETDPNKHSDTLHITDSVSSEAIEPPFKWSPSVTKPARWNLFSWA